MRPKSLEIQQKLARLIPGGVNSPVRSCRAVGVDPIIAAKGEGAWLFDVDGNRYIDYCGSWGALIHGHAHPEIIRSIQETASNGTSFGISSPLEQELAAEVVRLIPSIEKVRFVSTGTEATMSAVRLARGFTGRDIMIKFDGHYHGHADFFLVKAGSGALNIQAAPSSQGIPKELVQNTLCIPFNDFEALESLFNDPLFSSRIACVILEPIAGNMGVVPANENWMMRLRKLTEKNGTLLIFDEVMTGFRVAKGGAQGLYEIKPDLTCLGKIVGGGMPVAAFGGRADVMDCLAPLGPVYQAGTLSGNPLAMAAGVKSLQILDVAGFYEELQRKTDLLIKPIQQHIEKTGLPHCVQSVGSMMTLFFGKRKITCADDARSADNQLFSQFFRSMLEEGIYIPPLQQEAWFISMAHTDEQLKRTGECIIELLNAPCYAQ